MVGVVVGSLVVVVAGDGVVVFVVVGGGVVVVVVIAGAVDVVGVGVDSGGCMSSKTPKMISPISTAMSRPIAARPTGWRQRGTGSGSGSAPPYPRLP